MYKSVCLVCLCVCVCVCVACVTVCASAFLYIVCRDCAEARICKKTLGVITSLWTMNNWNTNQWHVNMDAFVVWFGY